MNTFKIRKLLTLVDAYVQHPTDEDARFIADFKADLEVSGAHCNHGTDDTYGCTHEQNGRCSCRCGGCTTQGQLPRPAHIKTPHTLNVINMLRDRGTLVHASFEEVASLSAAIDDQIKLARQANLTVLMYRATEIATAHGFTENTPGEDIALMHSELSEALEDFRNGKGLTETWYEPKQPLPKPCGIPTEMADELIRVLHFCGKHGIDIEKAVIEKMAFNDSRPYKHGGKKI